LITISNVFRVVKSLNSSFLESSVNAMTFTSKLENELTSSELDNQKVIKKWWWKKYKKFFENMA